MPSWMGTGTHLFTVHIYEFGHESAINLPEHMISAKTIQSVIDLGTLFERGMLLQTSEYSRHLSVSSWCFTHLLINNLCLPMSRPTSLQDTAVDTRLLLKPRWPRFRCQKTARDMSLEDLALVRP